MYAAAHLGYDPARVPIGGGAQVALNLIRRWAQTKPFPLTVLGSDGWFPRLDGVNYVPLPWGIQGGRRRLTDLSVREYASFSRQFERGVTEFLAARKGEPICVLHNDICEAGDFRAISDLGFPQAAVFHVDVVDYAASVYLRGKLGAPALARLWRGARKARVARMLPDVLRLIFDKQEACARHCQLLVVPSSGMRDTLLSEYPWLAEERVLVIPWGSIRSPAPRADVEQQVARLRRRYRLTGDTPVILTLSRISPEKGQDLLLAALRLWERRRHERLVAFVCGSPAFMHGGSYMRRLERLAAGLRRVQVHFPGYVSGPIKDAFFQLADLYVFPSRHESYGLTLLEAMAAGLPVLTTPHRSARDLVRPGFGRIVEATPAGLYRGLEELLGAREELPKMGGEARQFALERDFSQAADRLARALLSL